MPCEEQDFREQLEELEAKLPVEPNGVDAVDPTVTLSRQGFKALILNGHQYNVASFLEESGLSPDAIVGLTEPELAKGMIDTTWLLLLLNSGEDKKFREITEKVIRGDIKLVCATREEIKNVRSMADNVYKRAIYAAVDGDMAKAEMLLDFIWSEPFLKAFPLSEGNITSQCNFMAVKLYLKEYDEETLERVLSCLSRSQQHVEFLKTIVSEHDESATSRTLARYREYFANFFKVSGIIKYDRFLLASALAQYQHELGEAGQLSLPQSATLGIAENDRGELAMLSEQNDLELAFGDVEWLEIEGPKKKKSAVPEGFTRQSFKKLISSGLAERGTNRVPDILQRYDLSSDILASIVSEMISEKKVDLIYLMLLAQTKHDGIVEEATDLFLSGDIEFEIAEGEEASIAHYEGSIYQYALGNAIRGDLEAACQAVKLIWSERFWEIYQPIEDDIKRDILMTAVNEKRHKYNEETMQRLFELLSRSRIHSEYLRSISPQVNDDQSMRKRLTLVGRVAKEYITFNPEGGTLIYKFAKRFSAAVPQLLQAEGDLSLPLDGDLTIYFKD